MAGIGGDYRPSAVVAGNAAYNHWVKIGSATYSCLEDSLNSAGVANNIAAQINASDPNCSCTTGGAYGNEIFISLRSGKYGPVAVSSSDGSGGATLVELPALGEDRQRHVFLLRRIAEQRADSGQRRRRRSTLPTRTARPQWEVSTTTRSSSR